MKFIREKTPEEIVEKLNGLGVKALEFSVVSHNGRLIVFYEDQAKAPTTQDPVDGELTPPEVEPPVVEVPAPVVETPPEPAKEPAVVEAKPAAQVVEAPKSRRGRGK